MTAHVESKLTCHQNDISDQIMFTALSIVECHWANQLLGETTAILGNTLSEEDQFHLNFTGLVGKMPNFKPLMRSNSLYQLDLFNQTEIYF